ncbi:type IV secretion system protein [Bartonella harrusi]|uniref:Conjugal transfer protein n=1 Tax=Bartonella harrusi TaxID=2961895 RepID=A0ABY5EUX9_9HYPH|nr:type IV secretion system protein [Bartonella harrusi]UTO28303.1 conjugal transfer protein [Bartonella harrusi]
MKKIILTVMIVVIFGTSNSTAELYWFRKNAYLDNNKTGNSRTVMLNIKPVRLMNLVDLTKQEPPLNKEQLEQTKKTNQFITGNRNFAAENFKTMQTDLGSFFLKDPQLIYKINNHPTISASLKGILQEEEISTTVRESRNSIKKRTQYAAVIDKAVSLQTFQETENRFKQISGLLKKINATTDLKDIAELQAHIKGMLAMIQNEATKLQMVAYSRNAEQTLIKQQKQKRNMKILNSENKAMPTIRFIR